MTCTAATTVCGAAVAGAARMCIACGGQGQLCCGAGAVANRTCTGALTCTAADGGAAATATCL
jgi:TM2 domain-containing membrane protein YozV